MGDFPERGEVVLKTSYEFLCSECSRTLRNLVHAMEGESGDHEPNDALERAEGSGLLCDFCTGMAHLYLGAPRNADETEGSPHGTDEAERGTRGADETECSACGSDLGDRAAGTVCQHCGRLYCAACCPDPEHPDSFDSCPACGVDRARNRAMSWFMGEVATEYAQQWDRLRTSGAATRKQVLDNEGGYDKAVLQITARRFRMFSNEGTALLANLESRS
jgi:hypothetical protein